MSSTRMTVTRPEPTPSNLRCDELLAELFHALNQPLTGLRCSLEVTLQQPRTAERYREILAQALEHTEKAARLASKIQQLIDTGTANENTEMVQLEAYLQQVVIELLPLSEFTGVHLSVRRNSTCPILFDPRRLREGLFHLEPLTKPRRIEI